MYYQKGSMREIDDDCQSQLSRNWENTSEYQYRHKSKYEKSETSNTFKGKTLQEPKGQNSEEEKIKIVSVKVRSNEHDKESHVEDLIIQLNTVNNRTNSYISIHITSTTNPLFLWTYFLRESEFPAFKAAECLKVDFQKFPEVILSLLDRCLNMKTYLAHFEVQKSGEDADFRICEDNDFNECKLLLLKFKKANDEQAKLYFSQKYDEQKRENFHLSTELEETQSRLQAKTEQYNQLLQEKNSQLQEKEEKLSELETSQRRTLQQHMSQKEQEWRQKLEESECRSREQIQELENKIEELKVKKEEIYERFQKESERVIELDSNLKGIMARNLILEKQCENYEKQNLELKEKDLKISEEYHMLKNENTKLSCTVESLQDKLKEKDGRIAESSEVKVNTINQIAVLEEGMRHEKKKVEKLEEKIETLEEEIAKYKKKSEELEKKLEKRKEKLGEYKEIITIQESRLNEKEKENRKMLEEIVEIKREKEKIMIEINDKDIKIKDLKTRVEQITEELEDRGKIIAKLNKEISENCFGKIGGSSYTMPNKFQTISSYSGAGSIGRGIELSSATESRLKYSPSPLSKSPLAGDRTTATGVVNVAPFKKYTREGAENIGDQENSRHSVHSTSGGSRSPTIQRLSQQTDPEEMDRTKEKIAPIKFKK